VLLDKESDRSFSHSPWIKNQIEAFHIHLG